MKLRQEVPAGQTAKWGLSLLCAVALLHAPLSCAATLHGRVKDQQCSVLSRVRVRIEALPSQPAQAPRILTTDESGNYSVELAPGAYRLCLQREAGADTCQQIDILSAGDTWITTQLRDPAPDLSRIGNRSY